MLYPEALDEAFNVADPSFQGWEPGWARLKTVIEGWGVAATKGDALLVGTLSRLERMLDERFGTGDWPSDQDELPNGVPASERKAVPQELEDAGGGAT